MDERAGRRPGGRPAEHPIVLVVVTMAAVVVVVVGLVIGSVLLLHPRSTGSRSQPPLPSGTVTVTAPPMTAPPAVATTPVATPMTTPMTTATTSASGDVRSVPSTETVDVVFVNRGPGTALVHWVDFAGRRVLYQKLAAGRQYRQPTFVGHSWVVTDVKGRVTRAVVVARGITRVTVAVR